MPNPVTLAHVVARYRPLTDPEAINATAWITDIWELAISSRPNLEANMAADPQVVTTNNVIRVLAEAVVRKLKNPDGKTEEGIDDYRFKLSTDASSGLYLTADDLDALSPASGLGRVRSVRLVAYGES